MTLRMGDAIVPSNLPAGLDAYAGYVDGEWVTYPTIIGFPAKHYLSITTQALNDAECFDDEPGDGNDSQAPGFVDNRHGLGFPYPKLYKSISGMQALVAALGNRPRSSYKLWSAHYDPEIGAHICGPNTCAYFERLGQGVTPECDGTQWIDHGDWDESLLKDDFFGPVGPEPPNPPTPPSPPSTFSKEIEMTQLPPGSKPLVVPTAGNPTIHLTTDAAGDPNASAGCKVRVAIGATGVGWWPLTPSAVNFETAVENGSDWAFQPLSVAGVSPQALVVSILNIDPAATLTVTVE